MEVVPKTAHHKFSKQLLKLLVCTIAAFVIGLAWQASIQTQLSSLLDPPPAQAYCGGWIQCGAFYHVCGSCPGGQTCQAGHTCDIDGSPCPCGDLCFAIPMEHYMCSGASQAACGASATCPGGMCDTGYMSCSWSMGPTPIPTSGAGGGPTNCEDLDLNCGQLCTGNPSMCTPVMTCGYLIGQPAGTEHCQHPCCVWGGSTGGSCTPGNFDYCNDVPGGAGTRGCDPTFTCDPTGGGHGICAHWSCGPYCTVTSPTALLHLRRSATPHNTIFDWISSPNLPWPERLIRIRYTVNGLTASLNPLNASFVSPDQTLTPSYTHITTLTPHIKGETAVSIEGDVLSCTCCDGLGNPICYETNDACQGSTSIKVVDNTCTLHLNSSASSLSQSGNTYQIQGTELASDGGTITLFGGSNFGVKDITQLWYSKTDRTRVSPVPYGVAEHVVTTPTTNYYYRYQPDWEWENWSVVGSGWQPPTASTLRGFTAFIIDPSQPRGSHNIKQDLFGEGGIWTRQQPTWSWTFVAPLTVLPGSGTINAWNAFVRPDGITRQQLIRNNFHWHRDYNPDGTLLADWTENSTWADGAGSGTIRGFSAHVLAPGSDTIVQYLVRGNNDTDTFVYMRTSRDWNTWANMGLATDYFGLPSIGASATGIADINVFYRIETNPDDDFTRMQLILTDNRILTRDATDSTWCIVEAADGLCNTVVDIEQFPENEESYFFWCDMPKHPVGYDNFKCSGNPYCNYESSMGGSLACGGWMSCRDHGTITDNLLLNVLPPPTFNISGNIYEQIDDSTVYDSACVPISGSPVNNWDGLSASITMSPDLSTDGVTYIGPPVLNNFSFNQIPVSSSESVNITAPTNSASMQLVCPSPPSDTHNVSRNQSADSTVTRNFVYTQVHSPWWQVFGGNVHGVGGVSNIVPPSCIGVNCFMMIPSLTDTVGVISGNTLSSLSLPTAPDTPIAYPSYTAQDGAATQFTDYEYFKRLLERNPDVVMPLPTSTNLLLNVSGGAGAGMSIVHITPEITTDPVVLSPNSAVHGNITTASPNPKQRIILIEGDALIEYDSHEIQVNSLDGHFFMVVASGNITFNNTVGHASSYAPGTPNISGIFIAGDQIIIGSGASQFVGRGVFAGRNGVIMSRDLDGLDDNTNPAHVFRYDPQLVLNTPDELMTKTTIWQEVAPFALLP